MKLVVPNPTDIVYTQAIKMIKLGVSRLSEREDSKKILFRKRDCSPNAPKASYSRWQEDRYSAHPQAEEISASRRKKARFSSFS